jgi:hypothetical protein
MFLLGMIVGLALVVVGAAIGTFIQYKTGWPWNKTVMLP